MEAMYIKKPNCLKRVTLSLMKPHILPWSPVWSAVTDRGSSQGELASDAVLRSSPPGYRRQTYRNQHRKEKKKHIHAGRGGGVYRRFNGNTIAVI